MIAGFYQSGMKGWLGKVAAKKAWTQLQTSNTFKPVCNNIQGSRRMMLFDVVRKVLGKDTQNYEQQIGDCVSFGMKNAIEYLMCSEILMLGDREKFRPIFPPYLYGTGRVQVGGGQINGDGSLGSWMAEAVVKYGTIASDEEGCPNYSGSIARQWGRSGPPSQFITIGKTHPVKSAALISSWDQLVTAICNGYPCTVASNQGFNMFASRDGYHAPSGSWAHQMCLLPETIISCLNPKKIENIVVGDKVLTHTGEYKNVTEVFSRNVSEKIIQIKTAGLPSIKLTSNHPVMVYRQDDDQQLKPGVDYTTYGGGKMNYLDKKYNIWISKQPQWINAGEIKEGDYLVSVKPKFSNDVILPKWVKTKNCKNIPFDITEPNDELAWLFGLYAADGGSTPGHKSTITLSAHQGDIAQRCVNAWKLLGLNSTVKYYENCIKVIVYSSIVANNMLNWFSKLTNKHLPEFLFSGWNLEKVLEGVYDGDGCPIKNNKSITTSSAKLLNQINQILLRLGKYPKTDRVKWSKKPENWSTTWQIRWFDGDEPNKKDCHWIGDYYVLPVKRIKQFDYTGKVYNFEVDRDHSYVANNLIVHNCIVGIDDESTDPYAIILNSWGDAHGQLKDFKTNEDLPIGVLRVRKRTIQNMISAGETFACSNFEGFPEQPIEKELFKLI
jgi:intein/homing endonuclease